MLFFLVTWNFLDFLVFFVWKVRAGCHVQLHLSTQCHWNIRSPCIMCLWVFDPFSQFWYQRRTFDHLFQNESIHSLVRQASAFLFFITFFYRKNYGHRYSLPPGDEAVFTFDLLAGTWPSSHLFLTEGLSKKKFCLPFSAFFSFLIIHLFFLLFFTYYSFVFSSFLISGYLLIFSPLIFFFQTSGPCGRTTQKFFFFTQLQNTQMINTWSIKLFFGIKLLNIKKIVY